MMEKCSCVYVDDFDLPEFHRVKLQTAKKIHNCCECGRTIQPFEKYEYVSGMWVGCFDVFKTCSDCLSIRAEFFCEGWTYENMKGRLWEHIQDLNGGVSEDCLNIFSHLTPKAREMVCGMVEEIWEDFDV